MTIMQKHQTFPTKHAFGIVSISMLSIILIAGCTPTYSDPAMQHASDVVDMSPAQLDAYVQSGHEAAAHDPEMAKIQTDTEQSLRDIDARQEKVIREAEASRPERERKEAIRLSAYAPSDVAECRSRGNASFGDLGLKQSVMDDCLEARRLRAAGR